MIAKRLLANKLLSQVASDHMSGEEVCWLGWADRIERKSVEGEIRDWMYP